jgi:uncharacterized protein
MNEDLYRILSFLKKKVSPDFIFLTHTTHIKNGTHYLLLALAPPASNSSFRASEQLVENAFQHNPGCTLILKSTAHAADQIREGNPFFSTFCTPEYGLYNNCKQTLPAFSEKASMQLQSAQITHGLANAAAFLQGATFYRNNNNLNLSAFMLHQATEQALTAGILQAIGYKNFTHNLPKLLHYAAFCMPSIREVIDFFFNEGEGLLHTLQQAYKTRYDPCFNITSADIELLMVKVERMYRLIEVTTSCINSVYQQSNTNCIAEN